MLITWGVKAVAEQCFNSHKAFSLSHTTLSAFTLGMHKELRGDTEKNFKKRKSSEDLNLDLRVD